MSNNIPSITDDVRVNDVRAQMEHRAAWLYWLTEEAAKKGLSADDFARQAIFNCGCFNKQKFGSADDFADYCNKVFFDALKPVFEQDVNINDEEMIVKFHYCPLVASWRKLTDDQEKIKHLCDIAMDGDRGIFSHEGYDFRIEGTIAEGCDVCTIHVLNTKK